jgi:hypothetical protein
LAGQKWSRTEAAASAALDDRVAFGVTGHEIFLKPFPSPTIE